MEDAHSCVLYCSRSRALMTVAFGISGMQAGGYVWRSVAFGISAVQGWRIRDAHACVLDFSRSRAHLP